MTLEQRRTHRAGRKPVAYPSSDGKPMAETDLHRDEMNRLITTLQAAFADRPDVYVSGNLLLYYEEGNPRASVAPDTFVVFGVAKGSRDTYLLWDEGVAPAFVIEVTSRTTRREDLGKKRQLYARLGVREYVLYDPRVPRLAYLDPPLQGYHLQGDEYLPLPVDDAGALDSEVLDLRLRLVEGRLRFYRGRNGVMLLSPAERAELEAERARAAEQRAQAEVERADAEARRAEAAARRASAEARRASAEARRASAEAQRADAAERRIAELEALLRQRDQGE